MRQSLDYARARAMPRMAGKKPNKERAAAFAALRHRYGFTSDAISALGTQCKNEAKWNEGRCRTDPRPWCARVPAHRRACVLGG